MTENCIPVKNASLVDNFVDKLWISVGKKVMISLDRRFSFDFRSFDFSYPRPVIVIVLVIVIVIVAAV